MFPKLAAGGILIVQWMSAACAGADPEGVSGVWRPPYASGGGGGGGGGGGVRGLNTPLHPTKISLLVTKNFRLTSIQCHGLTDTDVFWVWIQNN